MKARVPSTTVRALIAVAVAGGLTAGCGSSDSDDDSLAAPTKGQLVLHFNEDPADEITNSGSASLDIAVVSANGGAVSVGASPSDSRGALRFPEYIESTTSPKAILSVVNAEADDDLDPGTSDFTFGADVNVDDNSESEDPANGDNGNNVLQRGLFEGAQYKLQIDHESASCRVKGSDGDLTVESDAEIEPGHWYRLRCTRAGDDVAITVTDMESDNPEGVTDKRDGSTGSLTPLEPSLPLSVGGKLNADGGIVDTSDQFNGVIDNVVLDIS